MKKKNLTSIFAIALVCIVIITGCDLFTETPPTTGSITGKVTFLNSSSHTGIVVSLESRTADITRSVSRALAGDARSITSRAIEGQTTTNSEGRYSFDNVPEGDYTVYASSPDSSEQAVYTSIHVEQGRVVTAPDLQLTAVGSIRGRILLDGEANGNMGFTVFIAGTSYLAITEDGGNFTISRVPSGSAYDLIIMRGTDTYYWDNVAVNAGGVTQLGTKTLLSEDFPGIISVTWKGALADAPESPGLYWAYYNTTDGNSYINNGSSWDLLAAAGAAGADGISIVWKGELTLAPSSPEVNWAYYDSNEGKSYIYDGSSWNVLAQDGIDGEDAISIVWLGEYGSAPSGASVNNAYYNTANGNSYIYNGSGWDLLAQAGADGSDGISIIWNGELSVAPSDPEVNWAYYNSSEGKSYIYDGTGWNVLAQDGADGEDGADGSDGISIVWLGEYSSAPSDASVNNAYYNTSDGNSYIYDGSSWDLLAAAGSEGVDGISIIWKGELTEAPSDPEENWAYYNTDDKKSWIWSDFSWSLLVSDGDPLVYVTFYHNGATGGYLPETIFGYVGEEYTIPFNPRGLSRTGYSFIGWNSESDGSGEDYHDDTTYVFGEKPITLNAQWTPRQYQVSFDERGGEAVDVEPITVTYDAPYGELPTTSKAGYDFDGWWLAYQIYSSSSVRTASNHTLYAKWISKDDTTYTVEHYKQDIDGTGYTKCDIQELTGTTDSIATAPVRSYSGFHENTDHEHRISSGEIAGDGSLVLKLYYDRNTYTVSFDSNGGSSVSDINGVRYETTVSEPVNPSKIGYTFGGWYVDSGLDTDWDFETEGVKGNTTLYAKWNGNSYSVEFDKGEGSGGSETVTAVYGMSMPPSVAPSRIGYIFGGYYDGENGTGKQYYSSGMGSLNSWDKSTSSKLYANWVNHMPLTYVEGGEFLMGSDDDDASSNEQPVHPVTVDSFYIGTYEVTQDIYEEVMGSWSNPSYYKGLQLPVGNMSWYDAVAFCNALSRKDGLEEVYTRNGLYVSCDWSKVGYRLPTEAEWEYAARGGNQSQGYKYSGSDTVGDVAWYVVNSGESLHEVGGKAANELGLYDMSGNVSEFCWDYWDRDYYSSSPEMNPKGLWWDVNSGYPISPDAYTWYRVIRGGSAWTEWGVRSTYRDARRPDTPSFTTGLRVVVPVK